MVYETLYMKHIVISVINDFQTNWCPLSVNLFLGSRYYGTCLYLRAHCGSQVSYNDVCMWFIVGIFNKRSEHTLPRRALRHTKPSIHHRKNFKCYLNLSAFCRNAITKQKKKIRLAQFLPLESRWQIGVGLHIALSVQSLSLCIYKKFVLLLRMDIYETL